jgi:hypothetical protein
MDFSTFFGSLQTALAPQILSILAALGILIIGWLVAVVLRAAVRRSLGAIKLNEKIATTLDHKVNAEDGIAIGIFWFVILFTLVAVFNALSLQTVSAPIQNMVDQIMGYLPKLLAGAALFVVAWLVATLAKALVARALVATRLDDKLSAQAGMEPMSDSIAGTLFWLVLLMFLPAIVGVLGLNGVLRPLQDMINEVLSMLPNLFVAIIIAVVGWLVAGILRGLVTSVLGAAGAEKLAARIGISPDVPLAGVVGTIVFILVFFPALVVSFEALGIEAISKPASDLLGQFIGAIPNVIAAILILTITFFVARLFADLITRLAEASGLDRMPEKLGLKKAPTGAAAPSKIAGSLVLFFAMLFAAVEAAGQLALPQLADALRTFVWFAGDVLLGGVILIVGFWLAGLAYGAIRQTGSEFSSLLAQVARVAIIALVLAMGLRAMGIADDIVNLGFALTFGAIAVAIALAFGLGGREAAGKQLDHWLSRLRRGDDAS